MHFYTANMLDRSVVSELRERLIIPDEAQAWPEVFARLRDAGCCMRA
jgi:hypothetical protein